MEELFDDDYFTGADALGVDEDYGPPSPQQLMQAQANRALTPAEQGIVSQWKAQNPSFLERPVSALGGMKVWQVGLAGVGLAGVLTGVGLLAFGGRKR